jgi:hypothetical protein
VPPRHARGTSDSDGTTWLEPVTDDQYQAAGAAGTPAQYRNSSSCAPARPPRPGGSAPTPRERDELRVLLDDRARILTEARDERRQRAERAEHDLDAIRAELAQARPETGAAGTPRRRRQGRE